MSTHNQHSDRDADGRLLRGKFRRGRSPAFPNGTPKWWRQMFMTRRRRRANASCCTRIRNGADPDALVFPLGNHKPHVYYW